MVTKPAPLINRDARLLAELAHHGVVRTLAIFNVTTDTVQATRLPFGAVLADQDDVLQADIEQEAYNVVFHAAAFLSSRASRCRVLASSTACAY